MLDSQINTFTGGMNTDLADAMLQPDQYRYAENVYVATNIEKSSGTLKPFNLLKDTGVKLSDSTEKILGSCHGFKNYGDEQVPVLIVLTWDKGSSGTVGVLDPVIPQSNVLYIIPYNKTGESLNYDPNAYQVETIRHNFGFSEQVDMFNTYEDSSVSRVYITSLQSPICAININKPDEQKTNYSIFPKTGTLCPFKYNEIVSGSLLSGKYQYTYCFYDDSVSSEVAPFSAMIPVGKESGNEENPTTDEGISLKADVSKITTEFKKVKVYRLYYRKGGETPIVRKIADMEMEWNADGIFSFTDTGSWQDTEATLEEIQKIASNSFVCKTFAESKNRLIVGNIKYGYFEIPGFDGRAYPADLKGYVHLRAGYNDDTPVEQYKIVNGEINVDEITGFENYVHNERHSWCKYLRVFGAENVLKSNLPYGEDGICGGAGPYVAYEIIRPELDLSPADDSEESAVDGSYRFISSSYDRSLTNTEWNEVDKILLPKIDLPNGSVWKSPQYIEKYNCAHKIKGTTYADRYLATNMVGFKQGECYQFGIVFYNDHGASSPVYPIGNIYIPRFKNWIFSGIETKNNLVSNGYSTTQSDLIATSVGIRFRIDVEKIRKNLGVNIAAYEIVRAKKTDSDRQIFCLGISSAIYDFNTTYGRGGHALSLDGSVGTGVDCVDNRCPIAPTYSDQIFCVDNATTIGDSYNESSLKEPAYAMPVIEGSWSQSLVSSRGMHNTFVVSSPEISTTYTDDDSMLQSYADTIGGFHVVLGLESMICVSDDPRFTVDSDFVPMSRTMPSNSYEMYPAFKYIRSAIPLKPMLTSPNGKDERNGNVYQMFGVMYSGFKLHYDSDGYEDPDYFVCGNAYENEKLHNNSTPSIMALYKYFMPCKVLFEPDALLNVQSGHCKYVPTAADPLTWLGKAGAENLKRNIPGDSSRYYVNIAISSPKGLAIYGGNWGLHGPCFIISADDTFAPYSQTFSSISRKYLTDGSYSEGQFAGRSVVQKHFRHQFPYFRDCTELDPLDFGWNDGQLTSSHVSWNTEIINKTFKLGGKQFRAFDEDACKICKSGMRFATALVDLRTRNDLYYTASIYNNLVYNSYGNHQSVNETDSESYIDCFGGDTYVCLAEELWSAFGVGETLREPDWGSFQGVSRISSRVFYPVETRVNLQNSFGDNYKLTKENLFSSFTGTVFGNAYSEPSRFNDTASFNSAQAYNLSLSAVGEGEILTKSAQSRLMASKPKTIGELEDSYLKLSDLDLPTPLDLPVDTGKIQKIIPDNDGNVYVFCDTGIYNVTIDGLSVVQDTDSNKLILGEGEVFSNYRPISTDFGFAGNDSIIKTPAGIYWYDLFQNAIFVKNNQGVNNLSNMCDASGSLDVYTHAGYDSHNNHVMFSNNNKTLLYSEEIGKFVSVLTKGLSHFQNVSGTTTCFDTDNNLLVMSNKNGNVKLSPCRVKLVVNGDKYEVKTFDTVCIYDAELPDSKNLLQYSIKFATNRQGESDSYLNSISKEGVYYTPVSRDSNKARMRGTSLNVEISPTNDEFSISAVKTIFRKSNI